MSDLKLDSESPGESAPERVTHDTSIGPNNVRNQTSQLLNESNMRDEAFRGYEKPTEGQLLDDPAYQLLFTNHYRNAEKVCRLCGIETADPCNEYICAAPAPRFHGTRGVSLHFRRNNLDLYLDDSHQFEAGGKTDLDRFFDGEYQTLCAPGRKGAGWEELHLNPEAPFGNRELHRAFCNLLNITDADCESYKVLAKDGFYLLMAKKSDNETGRMVLISFDNPLIAELNCPSSMSGILLSLDEQKSPMCGMFYDPHHFGVSSFRGRHAYSLGKWGMIWEGEDHRNIKDSDFQEYQKRKNQEA